MEIAAYPAMSYPETRPIIANAAARSIAALLLSVECSPDPWGSASSTLCNDLPYMQDTKLGHALTLISSVGETTEGLEDKWLNRSVRQYAPPDHLYRWHGPLIFVSWHVDEDAQFQKLCDVSMRDYHHAGGADRGREEAVGRC
ncbi:hypothetical protein HYQ46_000900 [Verticillium longisporum]|nr:hypothetical protein HYQ46_000900 [Verticillium longisporum]